MSPDWMTCLTLNSKVALLATNGVLPDSSLADRCRTPRASESVRDCAELDAIAHERRVQLTAFELGRPGECVERAHVDACGPCGIIAHALHAITENLVVVKFAERVLGALERVDVGRSAHPSRLGQ